MLKTRRKCRWLLWGSVAGLAVTVGLAVWSEAAGFYYNEKPYGQGNFFMLDRSSVWVTFAQDDNSTFLSGIPLYQRGWNRTGAMVRGFTPREWWPKAGRHSLGGIVVWHARVPLWMPVAAFALAGWWGWRLGRRIGPGACEKCGYDLRGVVGGVCPECGRGALSQGASAERR